MPFGPTFEWVMTKTYVQDAHKPWTGQIQGDYYVGAPEELRLRMLDYAHPYKPGRPLGTKPWPPYRTPFGTESSSPPLFDNGFEYPPEYYMPDKDTVPEEPGLNELPRYFRAEGEVRQPIVGKPAVPLDMENVLHPSAWSPDWHTDFNSRPKQSVSLPVFRSHKAPGLWDDFVGWVKGLFRRGTPPPVETIPSGNNPPPIETQPMPPAETPDSSSSTQPPVAPVPPTISPSVTVTGGPMGLVGPSSLGRVSDTPGGCTTKRFESAVSMLTSTGVQTFYAEGPYTESQYRARLTELQGKGIKAEGGQMVVHPIDGNMVMEHCAEEVVVDVLLLPGMTAMPNLSGFTIKGGALPIKFNDFVQIYRYRYPSQQTQQQMNAEPEMRSYLGLRFKSDGTIIMGVSEADLMKYMKFAYVVAYPGSVRATPKTTATVAVSPTLAMTRMGAPMGVRSIPKMVPRPNVPFWGQSIDEYQYLIGQPNMNQRKSAPNNVVEYSGGGHHGHHGRHHGGYGGGYGYGYPYLWDYYPYLRTTTVTCPQGCSYNSATQKCMKTCEGNVLVPCAQDCPQVKKAYGVTKVIDNIIQDYPEASWPDAGEEVAYMPQGVIEPWGLYSISKDKRAFPPQQFYGSHDCKSTRCGKPWHSCWSKRLNRCSCCGPFGILQL